MHQEIGSLVTENRRERASKTARAWKEPSGVISSLTPSQRVRYHQVTELLRDELSSPRAHRSCHCSKQVRLWITYHVIRHHKTAPKGLYVLIW